MRDPAEAGQFSNLQIQNCFAKYDLVLNFGHLNFDIIWNLDISA